MHSRGVKDRAVRGKKPIINPKEAKNPRKKEEGQKRRRVKGFVRRNSHLGNNKNKKITNKRCPSPARKGLKGCQRKKNPMRSNGLKRADKKGWDSVDLRRTYL